MATQLNIKDPEVHRLANELARRRGVSATRAVRVALEETLVREPDPLPSDPVARADAMLALLAEGAKKWPQDKTTEELIDELYDDDGLPV